MKTTGAEGREFYEQFAGKRVYIKCSESEPGKACDYINAEVTSVDEDSITISDPVDRTIPFSAITEIGVQEYNEAV